MSSDDGRKIFLLNDLKIFYIFKNYTICKNWPEGIESLHSKMNKKYLLNSAGETGIFWYGSNWDLIVSFKPSQINESSLQKSGLFDTDLIWKKYLVKNYKTTKKIQKLDICLSHNHKNHNHKNKINCKLSVIWRIKLWSHKFIRAIALYF